MSSSPRGNSGMLCPPPTPADICWPPKVPSHVVFCGADNHVHELWWDGNSHHNDLTVAAAPPGRKTSSQNFPVNGPFRLPLGH